MYSIDDWWASEEEFISLEWQTKEIIIKALFLKPFYYRSPPS
jgi:hypothetical protein